MLAPLLSILPFNFANICLENTDINLLIHIQLCANVFLWADLKMICKIYFDSVRFDSVSHSHFETNEKVSRVENGKLITADIIFILDSDEWRLNIRNCY